MDTGDVAAVGPARRAGLAALVGAALVAALTIVAVARRLPARPAPAPADEASMSPTSR